MLSESSTLAFDSKNPTNSISFSKSQRSLTFTLLRQPNQSDQFHVFLQVTEVLDLHSFEATQPSVNRNCLLSSDLSSLYQFDQRVVFRYKARKIIRVKKVLKKSKASDKSTREINKR
ncbi:hypothetical protein AMTR_s00115p00091170 [Amborella trichopoda]|uniref:Uncharacterized protein n=1 Tax=Amborella trichopoda TaxID=13333 RepID=W1NSM2_AMBTC|nr:hypothetical protein AMTR_s00115p00091170 [Amborella trichopoda]